MFTKYMEYMRISRNNRDLFGLSQTLMALEGFSV